MANIERTYNIPLRKEFMKVPLYRRAKKATTAVKDFLKRHMKDERVKIGKHLNEAIWAKGIKNPPHHVKVNVRKDDNGVYAELVGFPFEEKKEKKESAKAKKPVKKEEKAEKKAPEKKE